MVTTTFSLLMSEVFQSFNLRDGLIESHNILASTLQYGKIFQHIHEVEQHIFICEVRISKCEGGTLLQVCLYVYVECFLSSLTDDVVCT